jgi:hypothetical protein
MVGNCSTVTAFRLGPEDAPVTEKTVLPTGRLETNVRTTRANFARKWEDVERMLRGVRPRGRRVGW